MPLPRLRAAAPARLVGAPPARAQAAARAAPRAGAIGQRGAGQQRIQAGGAQGVQRRDVQAGSRGDVVRARAQQLCCHGDRLEGGWGVEACSWFRPARGRGGAGGAPRNTDISHSRQLVGRRICEGTSITLRWVGQPIFVHAARMLEPRGPAIGECGWRSPQIPRRREIQGSAPRVQMACNSWRSALRDAAPGLLRWPGAGRPHDAWSPIRPAEHPQHAALHALNPPHAQRGLVQGSPAGERTPLDRGLPTLQKQSAGADQTDVTALGLGKAHSARLACVTTGRLSCKEEPGEGC